MIEQTNVRIAAVFATMNRSRTAEACVRALARQTRPPEWVLVADNVSTDDTLKVLSSLGDLPFELVVHEMRENLGNAGGVREVMELAFAKGADSVWILDDDSWPREEALERLSAEPWDSSVVRIPMQIDPQSGNFTWPLQVRDAGGGWRLAKALSELPPGEIIATRNNWTGSLVSRQIREVVGPVNGELFIRGEDEEYPWRIERAGFTQEAIPGAVMDHPGPVNVVNWKLGSKNFFFEQGLVDWKLYYKVRNMVWLKRRQAGAIRALSMAAAYTFAALVLDGPGCAPLLCRAIHDGWKGRLGKM